MGQSRLFLPLRSEFHTAFKNKTKTAELRGVKHRFNEKKVYPGRRVELRAGYVYDPIWGTITEVKTYDSLKDIPKRLWELIIPHSMQGISKQFITEYEAKYNRFIVFNIKVD